MGRGALPARRADTGAMRATVATRGEEMGSGWRGGRGGVKRSQIEYMTGCT